MSISAINGLGETLIFREESVKPRSGVWIQLDDCMAICSECNTLGCYSRYCANCGARMQNVEQT